MEFNSDNTIVYTVLIGQNEGLNSQPFIRNSKLRHVCLTDDENLYSDDWEILHIKPLLPMDPYRSQRNLKIRPHLIFPEYNYSFYFDNTVVLKCSVEKLINKLFSDQIYDMKNFFYLKRALVPFQSY